uniref:Uncharacterized protein n=1 Tax=Populus alba TaxID=43335 RepID=A0A4U5MZX8_POPAL|nr:hypothetical protein D5086_0000289440 [Populus alba]
MAEFSCRGFVDVATTLIQVQIETETGDTALMLAAKADQAGYFPELIVSGAELDLVNNNGETAVQLAKRSVFGSSLADIFRQAITTGRKVYSNLELESEFGNTELLQMILQYSTEDIIKHDGLGLTPTMVSVKAGHTEAFRLLIDGRADISEKSRDCQPVVSLFQNRRALHFAARVGNLPAIVQLLEMGFPINSVDDSGHSPLMLASREGHAYACKLLLQRGVDCRIVNLRGETAISLAR